MRNCFIHKSSIYIHCEKIHNGYNEYITVVEDDSGFILLRTDKRAAFILLYSWFFTNIIII
jgi:hypothetical protein